MSNFMRYMAMSRAREHTDAVALVPDDSQDEAQSSHFQGQLSHIPLLLPSRSSKVFDRRVRGFIWLGVGQSSDEWNRSAWKGCAQLTAF
jgi:hypothetical protein